MQKNKITVVTRRAIADRLTLDRLWYHGRLREADFLNRLYDLKNMASTDYRPEYDNAYKDILQHADNNPGDWQPDWLFTDERFNLMHCQDDDFLKFLSETLSPHVREDDGTTEKMLAIYNQELQNDGFQLYEKDKISERPVFGWTSGTTGLAELAAKAIDIKQYLDTEYVNRKVAQMNKAILTDTDVALGNGKELLEIICKSILKDKGIIIDKSWTLAQLLKATTNALDFKPKEADDPTAAERSIKQILGGISTIVQGVTELRNAYGSGHGKDSGFKGLESKYAKLFVGVVAEIAIIYLATHGRTVLSA